MHSAKSPDPLGASLPMWTVGGQALTVKPLIKTHFPGLGFH